LTARGGIFFLSGSGGSDFFSFGDFFVLAASNLLCSVDDDAAGALLFSWRFSFSLPLLLLPPHYCLDRKTKLKRLDGISGMGLGNLFCVSGLPDRMDAFAFGFGLVG
jgi:hypothetical protein